MMSSFVMEKNNEDEEQRKLEEMIMKKERRLEKLKRKEKKRVREALRRLVMRHAEFFRRHQVRLVNYGWSKLEQFLQAADHIRVKRSEYRLVEKPGTKRDKHSFVSSFDKDYDDTKNKSVDNYA